MSRVPKEEEEKKPALLPSHINSLKNRKRKPIQVEDKKPIEPLPHINLKIKGQDGKEVSFRMRKSTQLKTIMDAYCEQQSVSPDSVAFLFDGRRIRWNQIPEELGMENGDEIDAMLHQTGGAFA